MSPPVTLFALLSTTFLLSTMLYQRTTDWSKREGGDHLLQVLLGDGRKILANHLFTQADVYFHSGYYPSIFDQKNLPSSSDHMQTEHEDCDGHDHEAEGHQCKDPHQTQHEREMDYLKKPLDAFEAFGRRFTITSHTHLSGGTEREMLPWLKLSAELDPQRVETYTVAGYWLRRRLGKIDEAEDFLRQGLKANPDSYEILFELGQLYSENRQDPLRARNLWEAAYQRWERRESGAKEPNLFVLDQILVRLARLEEQAGNRQKAIEWLELAVAKDASPNADALNKQIAALKQSPAQ